MNTKNSMTDRYSALDVKGKDLAIKGFCYLAAFLCLFTWWLWPTEKPQANSDKTQISTQNNPPEHQTKTLSQAETFLICTSAIAAIFNKPENSINVDKLENNIVYTSYTRQSDKTTWKNRCKIEGNKIIWAAETGRWRTDPAESTLTYKITNSQIIITETHPDNSATISTFMKK